MDTLRDINQTTALPWSSRCIRWITPCATATHRRPAPGARLLRRLQPTVCNERFDHLYRSINRVEENAKVPDIPIIEENE